MSDNADGLYRLLPAIYRMRDSEKKELLNYLSVLAKQAGAVEEDIARLYDSWFIETCDEWVVPYIGSLLGVRGLHPVSEKAQFSQRSRVANTLSYRRRKGTASMLEQLAFDSTNWQARAVEFFELLVTTVNVNHVRLRNHGTPDIRDGEKMELIDTPFDAVGRSADVRHIESKRGRHNIPHVGLYLWRLEAYPVEQAPAFYHKNGHYSFSQLGNDIRLFNNPDTETEQSSLAEDINVPSPIRRRAFYNNRGAYYGKDQSIFIRVDDAEIPPERYAFRWDDDNELINFLRDDLGFPWVDTATVIRWDSKIRVVSGTDYIEIGINGTRATLRTGTDQIYGFEVKDKDINLVLYLDVIVPCDLTDWEHEPQKGQIAVDPILGRIAFPDDSKRDVKVSYFYGFSSDLGGGPYERGSVTWTGPGVFEIAKNLPSGFKSIKSAIQQWEVTDKPNALFLIKDSETYDESIDLDIPAGRTVEIRADNGERPTLHLKKPLGIKGDDPVSSEEGAKISFDGLLITGSSLKIKPGDLRSLNISHCTLVPGAGLKPDGKPKYPGKDSIKVEKENYRENAHLEITIYRSITGALDLDSANRLNIKDSIVDGLGGRAIKGDVTAVIEESTIMGDVSVLVLELGNNSIFTGKVIAEKKQEGCLRFSYTGKGSDTPRRYNCQPETYIKKVQDALSTRVKGRLIDRESLKKTIETFLISWYKPVFADTRYGHPEYGSLYLLCPDGILRGADDEAEMGVFHHLMQPRREANLREGLDEYLRFGLEAGILYTAYEE